jgi:S-adenosylhomocysteine hydrolase
MIVRVYKTEHTLCDLAGIEKLVNSFQYFFVMRVAPTLVLPLDMNSFAIDPSRFATWFEQSAKKDLADVRILITSSRIELPRQKSVYSFSASTSIISDHHWCHDECDTKIRLARHILQIGMASFQCHASPVESCVCDRSDDFDCLCTDCETFLRGKDYRDGIFSLKEAFNILNQLRSSPDASLPKPRDGSQLRLAMSYASEISENERRLGRPSPFEGYILLVVLHFLSDLIPFVNALHKLGCRYEDMYLIAKPYPYARRDEVNHHLSYMGINTIRASKSDPIEECATHILDDLVIRFGQESGRKILVIEDGGYFAPLLHHTKYSDLLHRCIGVVEQTQKGINNDENIANIDIPILSVAQSDFKKTYESSEIGRVTVQNIGRFTPNTKLSGEHAILFGFGSVGQEVAFHLTNTFNMTVSVVDSNEFPILRARHRKSIVAEAQQDFNSLRFKDMALLVVGSTGGGKPSITKSVLRQLRDGAVIVSTSSDREEIDIKALEKLAEGRKVEIAMGKEKYTIVDENGNTKNIFLLAEGYPINFYASESLPNDSIDPVMTLLLLCAVELAISDRSNASLAKGVLKKEVNEITEKRDLVVRFLKRSTLSEK